MQCNTVAKLQLNAPTCTNKLKDFCSLGFNMPRMFIFYNITYNPLSFLVIFFLLIMLTNHMQSNNTAMDNTNNMNQIKIHFYYWTEIEASGAGIPANSPEQTVHLMDGVVLILCIFIVRVFWHQLNRKAFVSLVHWPHLWTIPEYLDILMQDLKICQTNWYITLER